MTRIAEEERLIERVVVRLNATLTGVVIGILCGAGILLATLWLVIKGGPQPGAHLILLSQYFPGYTVTVVGSFIGFMYGFVIGFLCGAFLGLVYNRIAR
ncbi:MAG: hypothetical protein H6Q05_2515 [Acidobacteria bacterium]|nr:hypothetical protein [Acidobacteriota bacterium]